ncbi:ATP-dependent protease [Clostridium zeae]|uniref:endopeptidase La n=1 Tax=Clostridium zeae TaxID=2759022 RepID=A0ABQ1E821_9CLOT|nr:AAA family ATPase [Clostridium zeae]GFZ30937.1 ATP-dependent protease [Clostridium zeae]
MKRELTPQEVVYNVDFNRLSRTEDKKFIPEYTEVYKNIETALHIEKEGFNVYLIDLFSKEKLENIISFIEDSLSSRSCPKDICYVTLEDPRYPTPLFIANGKGKKFKDRLEAIKSFYLEKIFNFYNSSSNKEKETIIEEIQRKRTDYIEDLVQMAKNEGFDVKATTNGFAFIPLKEGEAMTEKEYDGLEQNSKEQIVTKASKLKTGAEDVLEQLKDIELNSIDKIKRIFKSYLDEESKDIKEDIFKEFIEEKEALEYLNNVCSLIEEETIENYSMNYEDDMEKIDEIVNRNNINLLVDNKDVKYPKVIFEEDPSVNNLIGSIDYENHNGVYSTDVSLITAGSLLNANEGCLIIRASSLLNNAGSYYYLRKTLMSNKVSYDYNRGYLEFLALNGMKPIPIDINLKIIIIGDSETYDTLYTYDEDFKNLFKIKAEYNPYVLINEEVKNSLATMIDEIKTKNNLLSISSEAINEIGKFLSRKAQDKHKIFIDDEEIGRILILANNVAKKIDKRLIGRKEIIAVAYNEQLIEKDIIEMFKERKMLIDVKSKVVGSINGLSVLDTGYYSFGKPTRITCICYKGVGRIVDVHRESNLSGNIHAKSIDILKGLLNTLIDPYSRIPVDFHVSFEQTYGMLEGDSASIAELVCMISAISKIPIKQNIAVTGSLNQFGEVQPIGGVNEKIEGFYKVCKSIDTVFGKGVIIPSSNVNDIILNNEVERSIENGEFHLYAINDINDAIQILMADETCTLEDILSSIKSEIALYNKIK